MQKYLPGSVYTENYGNFEDKAEVELYQKMLRETDPAKQRAMMRQFEKHVLDDQAHEIFLLWWYRIVPHRSYVKGWMISPSHYLNQDLGTVWLDKQPGRRPAFRSGDENGNRQGAEAPPGSHTAIRWQRQSSTPPPPDWVTAISCPSCASQQFQVIKTVEVIEKRLARITVLLILSVISCVVNGPGEAREIDIGLTAATTTRI